MRAPYKSIDIIGDPIMDKYIEIKDGKYSSQIFKDGGAKNTYYSLYKLLGGFKDTSLIVWLNKNGDICEQNELVLTRYVNHDRCQADTYYETTTQLDSFYTDMYEETISEYAKVVVFSDYNKGILSNVVKPAFKPAFVVYDSKYRSIPDKLLNLGRVNIWRCTGKEYDVEYARKFDYIIHSNADYPVTILGKDTLPFDELEVPDTEVVDTIGAGDTMTAAIAAYLSQIELADFEYAPRKHLRLATQFAINACQEVITEKYVAIPKTTLKDWIKQNVHQ
jgi:hypothetical protein